MTTPRPHNYAALKQALDYLRTPECKSVVFLGGGCRIDLFEWQAIAVIKQHLAGYDPADVCNSQCFHAQAYPTTQRVIITADGENV